MIDEMWSSILVMRFITSASGRGCRLKLEEANRGLETISCPDRSVQTITALER